jgi:hypothetical protein
MKNARTLINPFSLYNTKRRFARGLGKIFAIEA